MPSNVEAKLSELQRVKEMNHRTRESEQAFLVQCIWCGSKIRDHKQEDAKGVCLRCFYQMLSKHLRAQKRTVYGEFVSDR